MSYNELITLIDAVINRNGVQAITGQVLNGVLKAMVQQLGAGYALGGVAHPTDDPGTPDAPVCYFASETGTYTNFDNLTIAAGELALLCYDLNDGWSKSVMYEGFQSVLASVDNNVGIPDVQVSYNNGVLSFAFENLKGNTGDAAGFGTISASVDDQIGTPSVSVQESGPNTAKNLAFAFHNLKGETGVTSVLVSVDNTSGTPQCAVSLNGQQLTLAFTGLKGAQGDTGSSVAYPFTIVNNLTTNDPTQALSAAMGVQLEAEVSQLEAELDEFIGNQAIPVTATGKYVALSGGVGTTVPAPTSSGAWTYYKKTVSPGDLIIVNGFGGSAPRLWGFADSSDKIIAVANAGVTAMNLFLTAPENSAYIIINDNSGKTSYYSKKDSFGENKSVVGKQIDSLNREVFGETNTYTKNADGTRSPLIPELVSGDVIQSVVNGGTTIILYDSDNNSTTVQVADLPYTCDKTFVSWTTYAAGSPSCTMTAKHIGIEKRVEELETDVAELPTIRETVAEDTIKINGGYRYYTRNANGAELSLIPPILEGYKITGITAGPPTIALYDENHDSTLVSVSDLPFTADKKYVGYAVYAAGSPEVTMTVQVTGLEKRVEELEQGGETNSLAVHLPSKIYAVVGDTLQIFYRSIIGAVDPYVYDIVPNCSKGNHYPRYWQFTPEVSDIGTHTLSITIKDHNGNTLGTGQTSIVVVAAPASPVSLKNIFCFGDSLTQGVWSAEAKRRLVLTNTVDGIVGNGLSNIAFCGSMQKTVNGTLINYFGVGGWTWNSYITAGTPAFRFQVSGVTALSTGATYTNNGHTYSIVEINVTEGAGNILCTTSNTANTPTASGTLTKASGDGDATITFSSADADSRNPLWDADNDEMTFVPYVNEVGNGQIDAVCVLLSWNGQTSWKEYSIDDVSGHIADAKVFLDTLHDEYPSAKCFVMGLQMPSINGGLGANYGASGGYIDRYGLFETVFSYNEALEALCLSNDYNSFCEFVPVGTEFDSEYNMPSASTKVNKRNATTEKLGTNGVHPDTSGQYQIADAIYRTIVANFCQSE